MSNEIKVKISKDIVSLSNLSKKELEIESNLLLVINLYLQGKISLSKASELSKLKVDEFLEELRKRKILRNIGPSSVDELEKDYQTALEYMK